MSVSKMDCVAVLRGKGEARVSLFRHFAPVTVNAIIRELPISSRVTIYAKAMICVTTALRLGVEKQKYGLSKGDVAFVPATSSICFFLSNAKSERPLNPVGKIEEGVENLERASVGDVIELKALRQDAT